MKKAIKIQAPIYLLLYRTDRKSLYQSAVKFTDSMFLYFLKTD